MLATVVLVWLALGLKLAFAKGERGTQVTWTGKQYIIGRSRRQMGARAC